MAERNEQMNLAEDKTIEQAYQRYKKLKQVVMEWQQENNTDRGEILNLAALPPYISVKDLPLAPIVELWQRLNNSLGMEVSSSQLEEIWEEVIIKRNDSEDLPQELLLNLKLAINGIAEMGNQTIKEKKLLKDLENKNYYYNNSTCPVCGEVPSIVVLQSPNGNRIIHCNTCNYEWPAQRIECIYCHNNEPKQLVYLNNEAFPGIEVVVCKSCGNYFKEIDSRKLLVTDYMWEDLRTIPLNYATELWIKNNMPNERLESRNN